MGFVGGCSRSEGEGSRAAGGPGGGWVPPEVSRGSLRGHAAGGGDCAGLGGLRGTLGLVGNWKQRVG